MNKFKKKIVPIGDHMVSDKKGNRRKATITRDRAVKWVDTFNAMKAEGLHVYAPWEHDLSSVPVESVDDLLNAKNNGGKWESLEISEDAIWGVIEAATEKDAEAIGTKVEGCSIFVDDYVDGKGKEWPDSILHICLTNKPVAVTENFEPVSKENNLSIAMSTYAGADSSQEKSNPGIISSLIESLKKIGICVPSTSDVDELIKFLTVAIDNSALKDNLVSQIPSNVTPKAPRIDLVMSTETQPETEIEAAQSVEVDKDNTSEIILRQNDSLKSENQKLQGQLEKFNAVFLKSAKQELQDKIDLLKESGDDQDTKDTVKSLKAQLDSTEFSFDENGDVVQTSLHKEIDLHLKYAQKKGKKVEENSDKVPSNVIEKEAEMEPNDDPKHINVEDLSKLVNSMPL